MSGQRPRLGLCRQENAELFKADVTSLPWKDYISYVDNLVLDEFKTFIRKSLTYLTDNMVMDVSQTAGCSWRHSPGWHLTDVPSGQASWSLQTC